MAPWSAFAAAGLGVAHGVGALLAVHLSVSLIYDAVMWQMKKRKEAKAILHYLSKASDPEELVAQQVPNQDSSACSSMDSLSTSKTSESEVISGEVEALDRAVGSPDKPPWTALLTGESSTNEISKTEMRAQLAQQRKMRERIRGDGWFVYNRNWVDLGKKIAEGGQADIYASTLFQYNNSPPIPVIVKKFKFFNGISQGHNPPGLRLLKCKNVCRPTGVFFDNGQLCLVMPRLHGDLWAVIKQKMKLRSGPPFPEPVAVHIIMQLAMGLKGLHEVGIYHRDLKSGNILVEQMKWKGLDSYTVYISDFESSDDVIGTGFYRAPEVLRQVHARSQGCAHGCVHLPEHEWAVADVYSFGMVCYEILTGNVPMIGDKLNDYSMALSGHRPELPPAIVPDGLRIMIERCWHEDPHCRPTPSEIIHHLKRIDKDGVYIPAPMTAGMECLVDVLDYIFQPLSFLHQQLFPLEKFMELFPPTKGYWRKLSGYLFIDVSDEWSDELRDWLYLRQRRRMRVPELHKMKFLAATVQQKQIAVIDELHIDEKEALLGDFVDFQFATGVLTLFVWKESEMIIRQMRDTEHRRALRRHLFSLCVMHLVETLFEYYPLIMEFIFKLDCFSVIVAHILDSPDYFHPRSPAFGIFVLLNQLIIGPKEHVLLYWRLLYFVCIYYFYAYFVGNSKRFNYLCLLDLVYNVAQSYAAYRKAGFNTHCSFHTISSFDC